MLTLVFSGGIENSVQQIFTYFISSETEGLTAYEVAEWKWIPTLTPAVTSHCHHLQLWLSDVCT